MKPVQEIDLICWQLYQTKRLFVLNQEPPELSLYIFKPVHRAIFKTL